MADEKLQPAGLRRWLLCALGTLVAGLCWTLAGCVETGVADPQPENHTSEASPVGSQPTPTPFTPFGGSHDTLDVSPPADSAPEASPVGSQPTPTPFTPFGGSHDTLGMPAPEFYGAAAAPLEERIYSSDTIVRAKMLSVEAETLLGLLDLAAKGVEVTLPPKATYRFLALEYLKGTGPSEITVVADAFGRKEEWEKGQALLFLNTTPGQNAVQGAAGSDPPTQSFVFTPTDARYPEAYTIESMNPVWLPATSAPQADGASGSGGSPVETSFATGWDQDTGRPADFMTLTEIKSTIAWVKGDGTQAYDHCVGQAINYLVWDRDWEAFYGAPMTPGHHEEEIASGKGAGVAIYEGGEISSKHYFEFWLTGQDAGLFQAVDVYDDTDPSNGYRKATVTARPLPAGRYTFSDHGILPWYEPCDFDGEGSLDWTITAVAPDGVAHEAFFDPVSIGTTVGADTANGKLSPISFTVAGSSASLHSLKWENGSVTLTLSPYASLSDKLLDFIALDGTISLTLAANSATVDGAAGSLTWMAAAQPWNAGDQLMLRIRQDPTIPLPTATPIPTPTPTPLPEAYLSPDPSTVAFTANGLEWHKFTVHSKGWVFVNVNPSGSADILEVNASDPQQDYCALAGSNIRRRNNGHSVYIAACTVGTRQC